MKKTATVLATVAFGLTSFASLAQSVQPVPVVDRNALPSATGAAVHSGTGGTGTASGNAARLNSASVVVAQSAQQSSTAELLMLLEQLQQEVQFLRGRVEEQTHQMKKMRTNQRDRYRDLDRRISNLTRQLSQASAAQPLAAQSSTTGAGSATSSAVSAQAGASVTPVVTAPRVTDREAYQQAFALVRQRSYAKSLTAFGDFIKLYPTSSLVPNAIFWSGEVYRAQTDYKQAKAAYLKLIDQYPNHQKTADAHYKLGLTYDLMGDSSNARVVMKKVVDLYPNQSSAKLAADYLKKKSGKKK